MKKLTILLILLSLYGCATTNNNKTARDYTPAVKGNNSAEKTVTKFVPVAMPGQLMPAPGKVSAKLKLRELKGAAAVQAANKKALSRPTSSGYINSIMTFDYMPGALYQIYCAPLSVTDIQFQNGEHIISVAAGDTLRWQVSKTYSGIGPNRSEHLVIKPISRSLINSLVITTDRRTYHLLLRSTIRTYMASVKWQYPGENGDFVQTFADQTQANTTQASTVPQGVNVNQLDFNYNIKVVKGPTPDWMPKMVFNNGHKIYIQFSSHMQEAPTLFVGNDPKNDRIINYRVVGNYYIIDGLFGQAQLRLGQKYPIIVQISYARSR
jgi:type IV secretion system protein VirB9